MECKRMDLVNLWNVIESKDLPPTAKLKFNYALIKNKSIIQPEIAAIQQLGKQSDGYNLFQKERIELCKKCSKKDESGNPKLTSTNYDIENKEEFEKELGLLQLQHKPAIDEQMERAVKIQAFMAESVNVDLYKVKLTDMPELITKEQLECLYIIIEG